MKGAKCDMRFGNQLSELRFQLYILEMEIRARERDL